MLFISGYTFFMTPLFGKKRQALAQPEGRTVLVLDIDGGSVGAALVRTSVTDKLRLFGETRELLPVHMARSSGGLLQELKHALKTALQKVAEVAARMRQHPTAAHLGAVEQVAVFLSPPWGRPNLERGRPDFDQEVSDLVRLHLRASMGEMPPSFYTSAGAAAHASRALFGPQPMLLCLVGGEVSELLSMDEQGVRGHATVPVGCHGLIRTLRSHGGYSLAEARSAAHLPFDTPHVREPFYASARDFAVHVDEAFGELAEPGELTRVRIIAHEPMGQWYARALTGYEPLQRHFPNGGEVRALRPHHLLPHLAAAEQGADSRLALQALFVESLH